MKSKAWLALLIAVGLVCSTTLVGSAAQQGGTLVFGSSGDVSRLDPADVTDGESIQRMDNIFEALVEYKKESTEVQPCLAESWEISEDGLEFTFYLRKGVKFHDGTNFNADAVVFSFRRQYDESYLPWHDYGEWAYWGWMFTDIKEVKKIDDYTVKIVLQNRNASLLTSLAMFTVNIVSPTNAAKWGLDAFKHPVGTGPFKFVEWIKDNYITLVANEDYWRKRPYLDKLIFKVIPDPSARLMALEKGEIDGMEYPDPDQIPRIKANPDLKLLTQPGMNVGYLAMNMWDETPGFEPPFGDVRVRRAIAHAINKKDIVDYLYAGTATVAKNPLPPSLWGYNDEIEDYEYNPEISKKLLAEAGYPQGFKTTLWAMPVSRPYMFDPRKIAEAIQSDLRKVGIEAEIYSEEWATYLQDTEAGKHPMCLLGWTGDNGDPDNFIYVLLDKDAATIGAAGNVSFYRSDELHEVNIEAREIYDQKKRAELYKKAQEIIHGDVPWVPLAHATQINAFRKTVHDYFLHPTSRKFFYPAWIEK
jgi:peptide/nickel transport system substrate-binding protein